MRVISAGYIVTSSGKMLCINITVTSGIREFKWERVYIQGCLANSYGANSYDRANSYGFSGKNFNLSILINSTFYKLPTRKFKLNLER